MPTIAYEEAQRRERALEAADTDLANWQAAKDAPGIEHAKGYRERHWPEIQEGQAIRKQEAEANAGKRHDLQRDLWYADRELAAAEERLVAAMVATRNMSKEATQYDEAGPGTMGAFWARDLRSKANLRLQAAHEHAKDVEKAKARRDALAAELAAVAGG